MFNKNWRTPEKDCDAVQALAAELEISELTADLLVLRGYKTVSSAREFLNTSVDNLHDPFLLDDMKKAVERIETARAKGEKVYIYGDYDADGVTSVYIMFDYLSSIGLTAKYYIPNRAGEGYGLNIAYIQKAVEEGAGLIITVDTGVTADAEVEYANSFGLDIIITDHHECRENIPAGGNLPKACAVINPKRLDSQYPFKELAGVGVAFKLISAHAKYTNSGENFLKKYAEFVAVGTIADVMPLKGENRILISYGLKMLAKTSNYGVQALLNCINSKPGAVNQQTVSFGIAPRLNAAGRMASASRAVDLFFAGTKEDAEIVAKDLCLMNSERQSVENEIFTQAVKKINADADRYKNIIFLADKAWHHGIIGIVASKLTDRYLKPVLMMTDAENDNMLRGSGRSMAGLNLVDALSYCSDSLIKFGGHELAAGFSVEEGKLSEFEEKLNEYIKINGIKYNSVCYNIDRELNPADLSVRVVKEMNLLEPFGNKNEAPLFLLRDIKVSAVTGVSVDNKHHRISFIKEEAKYDAMYFGKRREECYFATDDHIDILCNMGINTYMNRESLQLIIRDVRYNTDGLDSVGEEAALYDAFAEGTLIHIDDRRIPDKEDFAAVYKFIKENDRSGAVKYPVSALNYYIRFRERYGEADYFKFRIIVDILSSFGILRVKADKYLFWEIKVDYKAAKVTLDESEILIKLKKLTDEKPD